MLNESVNLSHYDFTVIWHLVLLGAVQVSKYRWPPCADERFEPRAVPSTPNWYVMFLVDAVDAGAVNTRVYFMMALQCDSNRASDMGMAKNLLVRRIGVGCLSEN